MIVINKVVLVGRLTRDPELKYTPGTGTAVTNITLAVDKYNASTGQREADFIPVVVWGKKAENIANYCTKGSLVGICGRIQTRNYEVESGEKRYVTEVVAQEIQFLGKGTGNNNSNTNSPTEYNSGFEPDMTPVDDGDIPF